MRIVHVYKDYHPILGGIENHVRTLAEGQAQAGHQVTALVTNPGGLVPSEVHNDVRVVRARRVATVASTPLSVDIFLKLRALTPDITHLHFPYPIGELAQLGTGVDRPYIITYHSDVVRQQLILRFYRPILMRVLRNSRRIVATSAPYIDSSPYLSQVKDKCTVVPLSVESRFFQESKALVPKEDKLTLLFVGRHRYYKGLDDLIHALKFFEARLLVAGDGPMRTTWMALADELKLRERVHFLGTVDDEALPALYASADIFVLPANSRAEAFGKVLLEAMAAGLPCITTELGTGTSFVVQHGITGYVVPPKEPSALAGALNMLAADADLRREMGIRGQKRARNYFTTTRMVTNMEKVYRDVLSNSGEA